MTAPRWEDAREHALKLLREERDSLTAELPRIESVDERELFDAWLARVDLALTTIGAIDDAALARLAEPAQPSAAVSEDARPASHPCARRCWRIGAPAEIVDGVCSECSSPGRTREPSAAERWRAVSRSAAAMDLVARLTEEAAAYKASGEQHEADALVRLMLLALAREAEGGGA